MPGPVSGGVEPRIRVGIGGWTFAPWRGVFYPPGLPHAQELAYASRKVTSIEINGTFYRTQSPATFRRWAEETPDDFVFSLKAPRYVVNRRNLGEAGEGIEKFLTSGLAELGTKLGPILWQMPPGKTFAPEEVAAFFALLPRTIGEARLRHAFEARDPSFVSAELVDLARRFGVAVVVADSPVYPLIGDLTADFVYARLQDAREEEATGYPPDGLTLWAKRFAAWGRGETPRELPLVASHPASNAPRDVFAYAINGAKVRAPAAAMAFLDRLGTGADTAAILG